MNLKNPFFSIIMPIYNAKKYLEKAINSVLEQTYQDFELLLVNDGSKDDSLKICEKFAEVDQRIRIIDLKVNKGVNNARKEALKIANGEYITYIDSDDYMELELLEVGSNKINEFNKPDAVKFGFFEDYYDKNEKLLYSKIVTSKQSYLTRKVLWEKQSLFLVIFGILFIKLVV